MLLFNGWESLAFTVLAGVASYVSLVVFLRISGKRTLAKLNAFDLVVTVALGSTLASVLTSRTLPLADGILALGLLIGLQYAVAWLSVRAAWFRRLVRSEAVALVAGGQLRPVTMLRERISEEELMVAVRSAGAKSLEDVETVMLETDGTLSVIRG